MPVAEQDQDRRDGVKPVVLVPSRKWGGLLGADADAEFELLRLWEAPDPDALLAARGSDIAAVFGVRLDVAILDRLPNLRLIVLPGAGYDGIPVAAARARGIVVVNAGATHSADVAEHAVTLTLASLERLPELQAWVRKGGWFGGEFPWHRRALSAQRFGIAGLGNIGIAIAERLAGFGGEIAWWGPHAKPARWPCRASLVELARWCSVLIVAVRGDARGLVDRGIIEAAGSDGLLVNVSRGQVVDEDALIAALRGGRLGRAALDVFRDEPTPPARWDGVPGVILTPHVGGVSEQSRVSLRAAALRNLRSLLDGGPVVHEVLG